MMNGLDGSSVMRIAKKAVDDYALPLEIAGVVGSPGGEYVEILVNVDGCAIEPCRFTIGAFRGENEASLLAEITSRLRRHVDEHRPAPTDRSRHRRGSRARLFLVTLFSCNTPRSLPLIAEYGKEHFGWRSEKLRPGGRLSAAPPLVLV